MGTHIQQDLRWLEGPQMTTLRALQTWAWDWLRCLRTKGLGRGALRCWPRNDFQLLSKPTKVSKKHPHPSGFVEHVAPSFAFSHHLTPTDDLFFFLQIATSALFQRKKHIYTEFLFTQPFKNVWKPPKNLGPLEIPEVADGASHAPLIKVPPDMEAVHVEVTLKGVSYVARSGWQFERVFLEP